MANIHKFSPTEAHNLRLGPAGSVYEDGTDAVSSPTGRKIVKIFAVSASVFAVLTPENNNYIGRTSTSSEYNGDAFTGTLVAGASIEGSWDNLTLASGSVICYFG